MNAIVVFAVLFAGLACLFLLLKLLGPAKLGITSRSLLDAQWSARLIGAGLMPTLAVGIYGLLPTAHLQHPIVLAIGSSFGVLWLLVLFVGFSPKLPRQRDRIRIAR